EALALGLHALGLAALFPRIRLTLSFPRLRPAAGQSDAPFPVSDDELRHLMAALRLILPDVGFVLSTRESAPLRDQLAPSLITQMSAGSRTQPGGYAQLSSTQPELSQFDIAYT